MIPITCKSCNKIFIFGLSDAVENATFCSKQCEEELCFIEEYEEEDCSMDMSEEEFEELRKSVELDNTF